jgi:integrase
MAPGLTPIYAAHGTGMAPEKTRGKRQDPPRPSRLGIPPKNFLEKNMADQDTRRFAFTKRKLEALAPSADGKRTYCQDTSTEGLNLCVTPSGTRTFYLVRWFQGRKVRVPLARFPGMSVEEARKSCRALVTKMAAGVDVQAVRQSARHEQTVSGLWDFWLEHAKSRKRSWKEDVRMYEKFLKPWAGRRLSTIRKPDVQALFAKIGKDSGPYQANRVLALLRAMFNHGADMGFDGANPAKGVKKFREVKRDRFLESDELPAFFQAVLAEPNTMFQDFFVLCILTGARRANVQSMAWQDVDLNLAYWRIPETKSGIPVVVPLVPAAVAILRKRLDSANGEPWVFPTSSRTGHLTEPKAAWKRLLARAGLTDLRLHDLRRSLGSWQAMGGSSLTVIGKSLGHTQPSTTAIYARLQLSTVRDSVGSATDAMLDAGHIQVRPDGIAADEPTPAP